MKVNSQPRTDRFSVERLRIVLKINYEDSQRLKMAWTNPRSVLELYCGLFNGQDGKSHISDEERQRRQKNVDAALVNCSWDKSWGNVPEDDRRNYDYAYNF